jgi:hypothetical protein
VEFVLVETVLVGDPLYLEKVVFLPCCSAQPKSAVGDF